MAQWLKRVGSQKPAASENKLPKNFTTSDSRSQNLSANVDALCSSEYRLAELCDRSQMDVYDTQAEQIDAYSQQPDPYIEII